MAADITLDGDAVTIEGNWVEVHGHDLKLDFPGRRRRIDDDVDMSGERRALVHDYDDGLTLNWAQDYPGGVTIEGRTTLALKRDGTALGQTALEVLGNIVMTLAVDEFEGLAGPVRDVADELWPVWPPPGGIVLHGRRVSLPGPEGRPVAFDRMAKLIADLTSKVRALEERVAALER